LCVGFIPVDISFFLLPISIDGRLVDGRAKVAPSNFCRYASISWGDIFDDGDEFEMNQSNIGYNIYNI